MVLFSRDGDFRPLVESVQRRRQADRGESAAVFADRR